MKDAFEFNPIYNCLRRKTHLSNTRFKHRVHKLHSLLADGKSPVHSSIENLFTPHNLGPGSQFQYTLYRMPQPNFDDLLTVELPGAMDFHHVTLKLFRTSQLFPINVLPAHYPRDSATAWRIFWLSHFPHQAHTVLWRYYHRKLPTRQSLHQLCPDRYLDPYCLLCGGIKDDEHFVVLHAQKRNLVMHCKSLFTTWCEAYLSISGLRFVYTDNSTSGTTC